MGGRTVINKNTRDLARTSLTLIPRSRSGQLEISFGMIFSIVLIIVFLAAAIYAIIKFLDLQKTIQIDTFKRDLQADIDTAQKAYKTSDTVSYSLPSNINAVCFKNDPYTNLQFEASNIVPGIMLGHIDIAKTTKNENPLCIQAVNGKVSLTLTKDYGESLVTIVR